MEIRVLLSDGSDVTDILDNDNDLSSIIESIITLRTADTIQDVDTAASHCLDKIRTLAQDKFCIIVAKRKNAISSLIRDDRIRSQGGQ